MGIGLILQLIAGALDVVKAFDGGAAVAKTTAEIQTAVGTVASLVPLVQQFANGEEPTLDDVRAALAGKDDALKRLDEIIASKPD